MQYARNKVKKDFSLFSLLPLLRLLLFRVSFPNSAAADKSSGFEILVDHILDTATVVFWFSARRDVRLTPSVYYQVFPNALCPEEMKKIQSLKRLKQPPHKKNVPHIIQPCPPYLPLRSLHQLNRTHKWAENFNPHLHRCQQDMIAQQHARIWPPPSNTQTYSRERISSLERHEQDISRAKVVWIRARKHPLPHAGWIKLRHVRFVDFGDRIGEEIAG